MIDFVIREEIKSNNSKKIRLSLSIYYYHTIYNVALVQYMSSIFDTSFDATISSPFEEKMPICRVNTLVIKNPEEGIIFESSETVDTLLLSSYGAYRNVHRSRSQKVGLCDDDLLAVAKGFPNLQKVAFHIQEKITAGALKAFVANAPKLEVIHFECCDNMLDEGERKILKEIIAEKPLKIEIYRHSEDEGSEWDDDLDVEGPDNRTDMSAIFAGILPTADLEIAWHEVEQY